MKRLEPLGRLERIGLSRGARRLLRSTRVAHLATADKAGRPHVIPICFVFDGRAFYSPIDEKPKQTDPRRLKRLRNISENPQVALVIDRYDEDWRRLAYVLTFGKAGVLLSGVKHRKAVRLLRRKYRQYRSMSIERAPIIQITPARVVVWESNARQTSRTS